MWAALCGRSINRFDAPRVPARKSLRLVDTSFQDAPPTFRWLAYAKLHADYVLRYYSVSCPTPEPVCTFSHSYLNANLPIVASILDYSLESKSILAPSRFPRGIPGIMARVCSRFGHLYSVFRCSHCRPLTTPYSPEFARESAVHRLPASPIRLQTFKSIGINPITSPLTPADPLVAQLNQSWPTSQRRRLRSNLLPIAVDDSWEGLQNPRSFQSAGRVKENARIDVGANFDYVNTVHLNFNRD